MTDARIHQAGVEAWIAPEPEAQIYQVGLEVWTVNATVATQAQMRQIGLEAWVPATKDRRLVNVYLL